MNFGNLMALRPLNDEKFILGNKSYDEVIEIAALRKVELDQKEKEFNKLQKKYDELKKSDDFLSKISSEVALELEDEIEDLKEENERLKLSLMTMYVPKK